MPRSIIYVVLASTLVLGCSRKRAPTTPVPPPAPVAQEAPPPPAPPPPAAPETTENLSVSDELVKQCKLQFGNLETAPRFHFNRAELLPEDRSVLERLAAAAARAYETQHLVRLTDRLTEADRVRSALLASVGHDLRTPLAGLKAAVSGLRQDDIDWSPQERADLLATIEESTDRLTALIADVLDATRIQVGAVTARPEPVAVDEVAALAVLDAPVGAVAMNIPDDLPLVHVDPGLLERVVANLVDNAVKHTPTGRKVDMTARAANEGVELAVVDHGTGVPPELWDAMFEPFQRLDDHSVGAGAGLGLAIVRGFSRAMGVSVTPSQTPGGGLTMTLQLPLAAAR